MWRPLGETGGAGLNEQVTDRLKGKSETSLDQTKGSTGQNTRFSVLCGGSRLEVAFRVAFLRLWETFETCWPSSPNADAIQRVGRCDHLMHQNNNSIG